MRCIKCGTEIDTKATLPDGTLQCPGCGAKYRPKTASEGQKRPIGRLGGTGMSKRPKKPRKRREKKPIKHMLPKLILCLLAIAALVFLVGQLYGRLFYKAPEKEPSDEQMIVTEAVPKDNYRFSAVDLDHVVKDDATLYASNEIILSALEGTNPRDVEDFISANKWTLIGYDKPLCLYQVRLPYDYTTEEDFERVRATVLTNHMFEEAYLNYVFPVEESITLDEYKNATVSNDKEYLPFNNNKTRYWGQTAIYLPQAYARLSGMNLSEVSVGVIDNQFYLHDDVDIWEALTSEYNPSADKPNHGTHVAGIIGAVRNNNLGIGGINDNIRLHCYRVNGFDTSRKQRKEYQNTFTWLSSLSSLLFNYDCKVVNLSMGIPWAGLTHDDGSPMTIEEKRQCATEMLNSQMYYTRNVMRKMLRQHDFLLVVAAGNDNNVDGALCEAKYCTPFAFIEDEDIKSHIIIVGNLAENHDTGDLYIADSSNYGDRVDILAPGTDIYSTVVKKNGLRSWWLGQDVYESGYEYMSGTSMAAPHVTGVAALLWSINPQFTSAQVREFILNGVEATYTYRQGQSFTRNEWKPFMDAEHAVSNALLEMDIGTSSSQPTDTDESQQDLIGTWKMLEVDTPKGNDSDIVAGFYAIKEVCEETLLVVGDAGKLNFAQIRLISNGKDWMSSPLSYTFDGNTLTIRDDSDGTSSKYTVRKNGNKLYLNTDNTSAVFEKVADYVAETSSSQDTSTHTQAASSGINWHNETFTYKDMDGYVYRITMKYSPWILMSKSELINSAWSELGQTSELPTLKNNGWNGLMAFSGETYQYGSPAKFVAKMNDMYYVLGTASIENITDGWHITEANKRTASIPISLTSSAKRYGQYWPAYSYSLEKVFYSTPKVEAYDGLAISAAMTSDRWGPVGFVIAIPEYISPNTPDGVASEIYNDAKFSCKENEFEIGIQE